MDSNEKTALIRMDMRGPSRASECLDCVVAFPAAIDQMRADSNETGMVHTMLIATRVAFEALEPADQAGLKFVAATSQDLLYRYIMELTILDHYTRTYCSSVVRDFFRQLFSRGIRTFFILDNTLREDRFQLTLELFEHSGIVTVTPRRDGAAWPALANKLRAGLEECGHVAYIEPDAAVNHLDVARELASGLPCVATFRNLAPDDPEHEIINFKTA